MRGITPLIASLVIIVAAIAVGVIVANALVNSVGYLSPKPSVIVTGGDLYVEPTNPAVLLGRVLVSKQGPGTVYITGVRVRPLVPGADFVDAHLINGPVVRPANMVVPVSFYADTGTQLYPNMSVLVVVEYHYEGSQNVLRASRVLTIRG